MERGVKVREKLECKGKGERELEQFTHKCMRKSRAVVKSGPEIVTMDSLLQASILSSSVTSSSLFFLFLQVTSSSTKKS